MIQNLSNAILITVIGMGLVFAAILLLWGLMALLVLIRDEKTPEETSSEAPVVAAGVTEAALPDQKELGLKQQAAAAAVAVALASEKEQNMISLRLSPLNPNVSAWQAFHRTNLIGVKQLKGHGR